MELKRCTTAKTDRNQSGVAAIFVVMVLMTVMALISVGFSQLMNREVRQSLDRQLSTEAFYAAESGVNDARNYLAGGTGASFPGCATPATNEFVTGGDISGDNLSKYTCVSVDVSPKELDYSLKAGESISIKLDLAAMNTLHLGWENQSYTAAPKPMTTTGGVSPLGTLPREDEMVNDSTGLLRIGLYPVPGSAATSADTNATLAGVSRNYFLYPASGAGTEGNVTYTPGANDPRNGTFISGNCNSNTFPTLPFAQATPRFCNAAVSNLNGTGNVYYLKLTALYKPISVSVQASDSGNNALQIPGTEAVIDVTGRANDILKRVRALVPIGANFDYPSNGLQSMQAVCKLFRVDVEAQGRYGQARTDSPQTDDGTCATPLNGAAIQGGGSGPLGDIPCPPPKVGNYPDCQDPPPPPPPPPPPACNVSVAGSHRNPDDTLFLTAQAGGCGYYYNNYVGWNGGGSWTTPPQPPGYTFCQQGGTDPWGFYAQDCTYL